MKQFWLVAGMAVVLGLLGVSTADAQSKKKASITVVNQSKWDIHHLYMSPADEDEWGSDQLEDEVIDAKGGKFELTDIPCDSWDIKVVDEDDDECVLEKIDVCRDQYQWKITDKALLACQGWE